MCGVSTSLTNGGSSMQQHNTASHVWSENCVENFTLRFAKNLNVKIRYDHPFIDKQKLSWGHIWTINMDNKF